MNRDAPGLQQKVLSMVRSLSVSTFSSLWRPSLSIDMNLDVIFSMDRPNGAGGGGNKNGADSIMGANVQALCFTTR